MNQFIGNHNFCQINIVLQYENLNNMYMNILYNQNMLQFTAKCSKKDFVC